MKQASIKQTHKLTGNNEHSRILSAGMWYTFSSLLLRGVGFFTLPVFARLLSTDEFGVLNNTISWYGLISILATLNLSSSLIRARHDFEAEYNSYISTILFLGSLITLVFLTIVLANLSWFSGLLSIPAPFLVLMMISLLVTPSIATYLSIKQLNYEFRAYAIVSVLVSVLEAGLSIILVIFMRNKLSGRMLGIFVPQTLIGVFLYVQLAKRGKRPKYEYCKYAIAFSLPLVPHLLANFALSQADRIMIFNIDGAHSTAMYSFAYSLSIIISILWSSMNSAFSPWLGNMIRQKKFSATRRATMPYILVFVIPVLLSQLLAPEVLWILGGEKYYSGLSYIPPVFTGCAYQFFYVLYVNIEQYEMKNWGVALGTMLAGIINVLLNYMFIPKFGPIAAAYTTMISYALLFLFHAIMVKRIGMLSVYNGKAVVFGFITITVFCFVSLYLYTNRSVRLIVLFLLVIGAIVWAVIERKRIFAVFKGEFL